MTARVIGAGLCLSVLAMAAIAARGLQLPTSVRDAPQAIVPPGTASIAGVLTSADTTSTPLRRAVVTATRDDSRVARTAMTDDDGRFILETLPQGRYVVSASKAPYLTSSYGSARSDRALAVSIAVSDGQAVSGINFKMLHGASISGRILDEYGQPMSCAMGVLPVRTVNGVRSPSGAAGTSVRSDDRGVYRAYSLAPGDYLVVAFPTPIVSGPDVVSAAEMRRAENAVRTGQLAPPPAPSIRSEPALNFTRVYFPGTADPAGAVTVTVTPGEDRDGVDFVVARVSLATISGTVIAPDGQPLQSATVTLKTANGFETLERPVTIQSDRFQFTDVPPGIHTLSARWSPNPSRPGGNAMWASLDVTVSGRDVVQVALPLSPTLTVSGRIAFDTTGPPSDSTGILLSLEAEKPPNGTTGRGGGPPSLAAVSPDSTGVFKFAGVPPGRYSVSLPSPVFFSPVPSRPKWSLASALIGGVDASELPVDIRASVNDVVVTVTDRVTTLSGTVRNASGVPTTDYILVAFPVERQYWAKAPRRIAGPVRPSETGRYEIKSLPPGEYFLAALTDFDRIYLSDIATLERLVASSVRVTLRGSEPVVRDVQVK